MKKYTKIMLALLSAAITLSSVGIAAGCTGNTDNGGNGANNTDNSGTNNSGGNNSGGNGSGNTGGSAALEYPDYVNPETPEVTTEKYDVKVQSEGGLPLSGVKVSAYRDDTLIKTSLSSEGLIELAVTLGEYTLRVDEDSLPDGYYIPKDWEAPHTNPNEREEVVIKIPSKLVETAASSYKLGQIMSDFKFTDCLGVQRQLSTILETKKAVVLNFFYTGCQPCRGEFPALQTAYSNFSDKVEVLAICSTHQGDNNNTVRDFKSNYQLQFPMGVDTLGLCNAFGATAFPTTVVIDRYGLIAYRTKGGEPNPSFWTNLFNNFTSDSYTQKLSTSDNGNGTTDTGVQLPDVDMPSSSVLENAANGNGLSATYSAEPNDIYSWPWLAAGDDYIYSSNTGVGNSYSIVHAAVEMKAGEVLSFEYSVPSEKDCDMLYVLVNGQIMNSAGWSDTDGWQTANVYVADRDSTVDLAFVYQKDAQDLAAPEQGRDVAKIRNIHLLDSSEIAVPMDVMRPAVVDGESIEAELGADGYYHKKDGSKSLLYMSLIQPTLWTDLHMEKSTTTLPNGEYYYNTIYYLTYYLYREGEEAATRFILDNPDKTDTAHPKIDLTQEIIEAQRIQMFMEEPYYLIPVTEKMQLWMEAFTKQFARDNGREATENEWLEMCYYFDHYGAADQKSYVSFDHTRGLRTGNAYTAYEMSDPALATSNTKGVTAGSNRAIIEFPLQTYRGTYYKFTAGAKGVYHLRSYIHHYSENEEDDGNKISSADVSPSLYLTDENGNIFREVSSILDFEQFTSNAYSLRDISAYLVLEAGETVYLKMCCDVGATGYYDFTIEYMGETHTVTEVCVTDVGLWESQDRVSAIETTYDQTTDCYYSIENGEPDKEIYIDFTHNNFMIYGSMQYQPLENYIKANMFTNYNTPITSLTYDAQELMEGYLELAKANGGKVKATQELVFVLQQLVDEICEGGGEGNGWLMFALYDHTYGA